MPYIFIWFIGFVLLLALCVAAIRMIDDARIQKFCFIGLAFVALCCIFGYWGYGPRFEAPRGARSCSVAVVGR